MKRHLASSLLVLVLLSASGCSMLADLLPGGRTDAFQVYALKGVPSLAFLGFLKEEKTDDTESEPGERIEITSEITFAENEDELYRVLAGGRADIAAVPIHMAARLNREGAPYRVAALNTAGGIYALTKGFGFLNFSDLEGENLYMLENDPVTTLMFDRILQLNRLDTDHDFILYRASTLDQLLRDAGRTDQSVLILSEPLASEALVRHPEYRRKFDLHEEWSRLTGDPYMPLTCLVVKSSIPKDHEDEWEQFMTEYEESIAWVLSEPAEAADMLTDINLGIKKRFGRDVIRYSQLSPVRVPEAQDSIMGVVEAWFELDPKEIGSRMPDPNFLLPG